jgi:hypothetical protein
LYPAGRAPLKWARRWGGAVFETEFGLAKPQAAGLAGFALVVLVAPAGGGEGES